jgi:hypothetical protein
VEVRPTTPTEPSRTGLRSVGAVPGALVANAAAATHDLGPIWYPVVLLAVAFPAASLGGRLQPRR